jgi:hypothetical protein
MITTIRESDAERAAFFAPSEGRNISIEILEAITFFARDINEAERLLNGDFGCLPNCKTAIWEHATRNGLIDDNDLHWGDRTLAEVMAEAE